MKIKSNLWFENEQHGYFGKGRIVLLQYIDKYGSISKAAKEMKMSYKAAWDAVNEMNTLSNEPIVKRITGGKGGGGTVLTDKGREYIHIYNELERLQAKLFTILDNKSNSFAELIDARKHLTLQTSARNQYYGTVQHIQSSSVEFSVTIDIGKGQTINSIITHTSAKAMNIDVDSEVFALIKSSWVNLSKTKQKDNQLNVFKGIVVSVKNDNRFAEIILRSNEGNDIVSIVSLELLKCLDLKQNDTAYATFLPSEVILAI